LTPLLPSIFGGPKLVAWRLDRAVYAATWDSGEGAYRAGGRWNSKGIRAVYCSIDAATAILEVAVHTGFKTLDTVPHVLTAVDISETEVFVVQPTDVPNPNWLVPGVPSAGQQRFGDSLLAAHKFILIPSTVSRVSWNIIFVASAAAGSYNLRSQERFALDTRLHQR
jgi:RES domain-containing protein